MLSSWDDFPIHQTAETIRHAATSDRNFYDRYYFNLHGSSDEVFAIFGLGQYPNLGVTDGFIAVTAGEPAGSGARLEAGRCRGALVCFRGGSVVRAGLHRT